MKEQKENKLESLKEISMICANYGNHENLKDVLLDWFEFLGGKPAEVIIMDAGSDKNTKKAYLELLEQGLIDTLSLNKENHPEKGKEFAHIREYNVANLARKKYLLFFKFDTLPYCQKNDNWLETAIFYLDKEDIFAFGGSSNYKAKHHDAWNNYYFSDRLSENFALIKRDTHTKAMREYAGDFIDSGFRKHNPDPNQRRTVEVAWEKYIQNHQVYTLMKEEDENWTVFHTNINGERLKQQRKRYKERIGTKKYLNAGLYAERENKWFYGQKTNLKKKTKSILKKIFKN
ncbi:MAG: hypothetical protein KAS02_00525 [Candidatus Pacebacteria bacterium]|nr:hypothetical protein [Candidatus Paceibacterota bacterium]